MKPGSDRPNLMCESVMLVKGRDEYNPMLLEDERMCVRLKRDKADWQIAVGKTFAMKRTCATKAGPMTTTARLAFLASMFRVWESSFTT